ncbi:MAG: L-threonylcarbamoyladenylate synthase [Desulfobulbus sp.]
MSPTKNAVEADVHRAIQLLRSGGVVAFPTETYYGLAVDPWQPRALERLYRVKQRSRTLPTLVLVAGPEQMSLLAAEVPAVYDPLIRAFWPGPLTLVCPARPGLPELLTGQTGTVGLRHSPSPVANRLIAALGRPITATSANISGQPAATTAAEAANFLGDKVDLILDGGATPGGCGSTLVGLRNGTPVCLREGKIPFSSVAAVHAGR